MTKSIVVSSVVPVTGGHSGAANFAQHMRQRKREKLWRSLKSDIA